MSKTYKIVVMAGDYCGPEVYFVLPSPVTLLIYSMCSINDRLWLKLSRFDHRFLVHGDRRANSMGHRSWTLFKDFAQIPSLNFSIILLVG